MAGITKEKHICPQEKLLTDYINTIIIAREAYLIAQNQLQIIWYVGSHVEEIGKNDDDELQQLREIERRSIKNVGIRGSKDKYSDV